MNGKPWRPEETEILKRLAAEKLSRNEICRRMKRSSGTIDTMMARYELRITHKKPKPWTEDEIDEIVSLSRRRKTPAEIAGIVGRHQTTIKKKLRELGLVMVLTPHKRARIVLPVADNGWLKPLTRQQLMAGRA